MLFHQNKIGFVHVPRTGGTSVEHALMKKYPQVVQLHANKFYDRPTINVRSVHTLKLPGGELEYQKKHATYDELYESAKDYKFYATVRHPLRRLESMYRLLKWSQTDGTPWTTLEFNEWVYNLVENHTMMEEQDILDSSMFHLTQSAMIGNAEWHKTEKGSIWEALDLEPRHDYKLSDKNVDCFWSSESLQLATDYYAEDFERFSYG